MPQGSLPSIEWRLSGVVYVSNIYTDSSLQITNTTTVAEFSRILINNNPAMREGDQLSFIRVSQMVNATTGYPYVVVRKYEVILNTTSTSLLNDFIPIEFIGSDNVEDDPVLFVNPAGRKGAFCMILSRTISGKTFVSSQNLVVVNNADVISQWSGSSAVHNAINSYGESEDAFLSSVSANQANNSVIGNSILAMEYDGTSYGAGGPTPTLGALGEGDISLIFSQAIPSDATISAGRVITTDSNSKNIVTTTVSGGAVVARLPAFVGSDDEYHIATISLEVNGTQYTISFQPEGAYSSGGLDE